MTADMNSFHSKFSPLLNLEMIKKFTESLLTLSKQFEEFQRPFRVNTCFNFCVYVPVYRKRKMSSALYNSSRKGTGENYSANNDLAEKLTFKN